MEHFGIALLVWIAKQNIYNSKINKSEEVTTKTKWIVRLYNNFFYYFDVITFVSVVVRELTIWIRIYPKAFLNKTKHFCYLMLKEYMSIHINT